MSGCFNDSKHDRWLSKEVSDRFDSEIFEDTLHLTFSGAERDLDFFMEKLKNAAQELAEEYGIHIEGGV